MARLRRDVARNRERIIAAARELSCDGQPLQLNAVAHRAEVGVGTVYRHFATPEALAEGIVEHRFAELADVARRASADPDALVALRRFLEQALQLYVDDPAFATAVAVSEPVLDETRALRTALMTEFGALVARAADHLRPELEAHDLMILLCGLGYSARLRPERATVYLDALMDGVMR
jgi:AcrR family transcriptional regulator